MDRTAGETLKRCNRLEIRGICHRHREDIPDLMDGDEAVLTSRVLGDELEDLHVDVVMIEGQVWKTILSRQGDGHLFLGDTPQFNEDLTESSSMNPLICLSLLKLPLIDHTSSNKHLA